MSITLLSPDTIGKIAAGEVVERPASVVKELVENSLDAGARSIEVELIGGGVDLIRVADDGTGIDKSELQLAFQRHATSKITSADDLVRISSLGFRGEALASIAAVSEVTLTSRPAGKGSAHQIRAVAGETGQAIVAGRAPGTTIAVERLFFNVPARRKFLRSPAAEAAQVVQLLSQFALAYPEVAFRLLSEGRQMLSTSGSGDDLEAAMSVLGGDVASALLPVRSMVAVDQSPGEFAAKIEGYAADSRVNRATRTGIWLFVNRRPIRSRSLTHAVEEAYETLLQVGRHPIAVVHLRVPPEEVDVNVHPTKVEVRLLRERLIYGALRDALREVVASNSGWGRELDRLSTSPGSHPLPAEYAADQRLFEAHAGSSPFEGEEMSAGGRRLPILRLIGQVAQTYIVAEGERGLYLIDQHAAHERVLLGRLMQSANHEGSTQLLLEPATLGLSPEQWDLANGSLATLESLGFRLEPFGERTLLIRGVPSELPPGQAIPALEQTFRELADEQPSGDWKERIAVALSCRGAVKAGQILSPQEMRSLIESLEETDITQHCSHGRPTAVLLSHRQLEREFGR